MAHPGSDDNPYIELAETLTQRGWRTPALFLLEAARPLALLGAQLLWLSQPALTPWLSGHTVGRLAQLLEEPDELDRFMAYLERLQVES